MCAGLDITLAALSCSMAWALSLWSRMYIISPPRLMKRRGRVLWAMTTTHADTWKLKRGGARVFPREKLLKRSSGRHDTTTSGATKVSCWISSHVVRIPPVLAAKKYKRCPYRACRVLPAVGWLVCLENLEERLARLSPPRLLSPPTFVVIFEYLWYFYFLLDNGNQPSTRCCPLGGT